MWLQRLYLRDFRNYRELDVRFQAGLNLLVGPNGAGKSNLLEAVGYLASGRSLRGARDGHVVRMGASGFFIKGQLVPEARDGGDGAAGRWGTDLEVAFQEGRGKAIRVAGKRARSIGEVARVFAAVSFSPADVELVGGPPALRRRFLDAVGVQHSPAYGRALARYSACLAQRNELLRFPGASPVVLASWDEELAEAGGELVVRRASLVSALADLAAAEHRRLAGGAELRISYRCGVRELAVDPVACRAVDHQAVAEALARQLAADLEGDRAVGVTRHGPHRDDLEVAVEGAEARTFASQGQRRTAALAVKLAAVSVLRAALDVEPVLHPDDRDGGRGRGGRP
ncbi:MAG: DNA replication and repair protein RecF, partial [Clostridia bacterium]|nr:DNA replication and repair protein RecF [Clostridia bacterium]